MSATTTYKSTETIKLNTGAEIPVVGLGTWRAKENEGYESVIGAVKAGYRHIDTAVVYGNEEEVGRAIKACGVPREELFITTKLASTRHSDPEKALAESLERLGLDYVDLYLMHWPVYLNPNGNDPFLPTNEKGERDVVPNWDFTMSWNELQKCYESGKAKSVGVSNFSATNLAKLLKSETLRHKPAVNQVECHPYLPQHKLLQFCKDNDIVMEAYSPLGSADAPLLKDETVQEIAAKYGVSAATIMISWQVQRGAVVLPKSVRYERIEQNIQLVKIKPEDVDVIDTLTQKIGGTRRVLDPKWADGLIIFNDEE